jgi:hypothetical protein
VSSVKLTDSQARAMEKARAELEVVGAVPDGGIASLRMLGLDARTLLLRLLLDAREEGGLTDHGDAIAEQLVDRLMGTVTPEQCDASEVRLFDYGQGKGT